MTPTLDPSPEKGSQSLLCREITASMPHTSEQQGLVQRFLSRMFCLHHHFQNFLSLAFTIG